MEIFADSAQSYDRWYESKMGAFADQAQTELALRLFKPQKRMHVLDVGCGTGNFSLKLARLGLKVTGIDVSSDMLHAAERKAEEEELAIDFLLMDAHDIKFKDNYFDGVFSMAALEFMDKPERALDEMFRVVKKGGRILVGTINKESRWGELYLERKHRQDSVFSRASLKTGEDLHKWKPEKLKTTGECLFLSPDTPPDKISWDLERKLSTSERGGFICALWEK